MAEATLKMLLLGEDRSASKAMHGVGNEADKTGGKLKGIGKMAKLGALGIGAAAGVAAVALVGMAKAAIADEKAQKTLANTLKNAAGATKDQVAATEDWITAQGKALGVTDDELRPALARLVSVTHDVGKAQKLTSIAMDVSAGTGKSLQTVTEALMKAQNGSLGGLSRLGIATKNADGSTKSLKQVTQELADTYSGAASTAANTTEGKFARLKLQFDETKEAIGARLIPIASDLADFMLNKMGPALGQAGAWAQENLLPALSAVGGFIRDKVIPVARELGENVLNGLKGFIDNVSSSIEKNKPFIDALGKALLAVGEFIYLKVYPAVYSLAAKALPILGDAIGLAITVIAKVAPVLLGMAESGVKAFKFLVGAALLAFDGILSAAAKGLGWIPGLGDKIKAAQSGFHEFRVNTMQQLDAVADGIGKVRKELEGLDGKTATTHINVITTSTGAKIPTNPSKGVGANANGTSYWRGGLTWVGERGPELVDLNRGARVYPAGQSSDMAAGGGDLGTLTVVVKTDTGEVIEQKLAKMKRRDGNRTLEFV
ncbi:MAG TPA: hypothetical protein VJ782_09270 [Aeromicrobium sp.]|nr:hypothetical protein [Aeromicrobium sp.]